MKTYFVSDTHFGSLAFKNKTEKEKKFVRWLDSIKPDCEALYMLGDMIDFWYEYKMVVPKGFTRFFGKISEFTDSGIPVYWFAGNHDIWLYNYVQEELGVKVIIGLYETNIYGRKVLMAHGDGLGDPSVNFHILRSIFHCRFCQVLFSMINPRFAMAFGLNWAKKSFMKRGKEPEVYLGEDKEHLILFSKDYATKEGENAPDLYIYGHRHIMLDLYISRRSRIIILGEWLSLYSYGVMDNNGFELCQFEP
jgi:UDP-2,3-diacylglucosamine hydrolase